jgi:Tat protein secretion system quality control protein TatD with DNase activity
MYVYIYIYIYIHIYLGLTGYIMKMDDEKLLLWLNMIYIHIYVYIYVYVYIYIYLGLTGYIMKMDDEKLLLWLNLITLDRLVIETDAPYMGFKGCRATEMKVNTYLYAYINIYICMHMNRDEGKYSIHLCLNIRIYIHVIETYAPYMGPKDAGQQKRR